MHKSEEVFAAYEAVTSLSLFLKLLTSFISYRNMMSYITDSKVFTFPFILLLTSPDMKGVWELLARVHSMRGTDDYEFEFPQYECNWNALPRIKDRLPKTPFLFQWCYISCGGHYFGLFQNHSNFFNRLPLLKMHNSVSCRSSACKVYAKINNNVCNFPTQCRLRVLPT